MNIDNFIMDAFENHGGLCVGETHHTRAIPLFLNAQLPLFRRAGLRTIYTEYYTDAQNALIRRYWHEMSGEVQARQEFSRAQAGPGNVALDEFHCNLRAAGIQLIGIDEKPRPPAPYIAATAMLGDAPDEEDCEKVFNLQAADPFGMNVCNTLWASRISAHQAQNPGPFLVHSGARHMVFIDDVYVGSRPQLVPALLGGLPTLRLEIAERAHEPVPAPVLSTDAVSGLPVLNIHLPELTA